MNKISNSLNDFWKNQKILSLFIITFFIRIGLCYSYKELKNPHVFLTLLLDLLDLEHKKIINI